MAKLLRSAAVTSSPVRQLRRDLFDASGAETPKAVRLESGTQQMTSLFSFGTETAVGFHVAWEDGDRVVGRGSDTPEFEPALREVLKELAR